MKKSLIAASIAIGAVAALWQIVSQLYIHHLDSFLPLTGLAVAGFFGWTTFYAMGGKVKQCHQGILTNLSGVFWGVVLVLILMLFPTTGIGLYIGLAIAGFISAGMMVFQAHLKWLSFIPAAFIGCTTFFALGGTITISVILTAVFGLSIGNGLGILSVYLTNRLERTRKKI